MNTGILINILTILVCSLLVTNCGPIVEAPHYDPDGHISNVFTLKYNVRFTSTISYLKIEREIGVRTCGGSIGDRSLEDTMYFSIDPGKLAILSRAPSANHFKAPIIDSLFRYDSASQLTHVSVAYLSDSIIILGGQIGGYDQSGVSSNSLKAAIEIKDLTNNKDSLFSFGDYRDCSTFTTLYLHGNNVYLAGATSDVNGGSLTGYSHSRSYIQLAKVNLSTFESSYRLLSFDGNEKPYCEITRLLIDNNLAIIFGSCNSSGMESSFIASYDAALK